MEELLDPPLADAVIALDPFADMALDANAFALTDQGGGTDFVFAAMLVDDGAMTQNLGDDSSHVTALNNWLSGFISERNSHPRIPGEVVEIGDDGRSSGWTDSMFALADDITVTANAMIDAYVLHEYMDALNYAQQILMLLQSLEAMAMQDLGLQLVAAEVRPQSAHPPPTDVIRAKGDEMWVDGSELARVWIYENDDLSGVTGMWDFNEDGDIDWNDASNIYSAWGMTFQANAAREAGLAFNDYQPDDPGNDPLIGEYGN